MPSAAPLPHRRALVRAHRRWPLSVMEQEISSGYPRLHEWRESYSEYFFELSRSWAVEEILRFFAARLKKSFASLEESTLSLSDAECASLASFEYPGAY